ncbi:MAG TPA: carboxypeptidase regulatory-like domain-containing protein [Candidatus Thermoplasmatota archaeon]|nr:carboxypeptidase regulatory-like domain-containing protein [Candidatus Thermoplasmatota archaeon]
MVRQPKVLVFSNTPAINGVALAATGRVRGEIISSEAHLPLEGVAVRLWDASWKLAGAVKVDAAGTFRFEGVAPGAYTISLEVPAGYVAERSESNVRVGAKGDLAVRFNVRTADTLRGRVVDGLAPAAGVFVDLVDAAGKFVAQGTTSETGDYSFQGLRPGRYSVRVHQ